MHPGRHRYTLRHVQARFVQTRRLMPIHLPPIQKEYMLQ